jgi:HSP20 family protein
MTNNKRQLPGAWRGEKSMSPVRELNRLQRRVDRVFEALFTDPFAFFSLEPTSEFVPAVDIEETDTDFLLTFDLPGVKKDEVKINVVDNELIVSGERKEETKGRGSRERYYGAFSRSFTLPANVDTNKVDASYENGVLRINLPKTAAQTGKQIPIKEEKPGKVA